MKDLLKKLFVPVMVFLVRLLFQHVLLTALEAAWPIVDKLPEIVEEAIAGLKSLVAKAERLQKKLS